ncbi:MAG: hypothetical protein ACTSVF_05095 [Candidatus Asgardarchaeia archaeon]
MRLNKKTIEKILSVLSNKVWGMTINDLSKATGKHRNTIAKYMPVLEERNLVVSRTVGKYTFWMSSTIHQYFKTGIARIFFQNLSKNLGDLFEEGKLAGPSTVGRLVGKGLMEKVFIKKVFIKRVKSIKIRELKKELENFIGIFIPTVLPGITFKVEFPDWEADHVFIYVSRCPCDGDPNLKSSCEFMAGFIQGVFEGMEFHVKRVEEVECQMDGFNACKFRVDLSSKIMECIEKSVFRRLRSPK